LVYLFKQDGQARPSKVNGKGKGRILNNGKGNVAKGKGNTAEIEFKNLFINSKSGAV